MPNLSASENVNSEKLYPEQMIASLRSILTTGEADLARSLQRIAEAARSLTGAGGAAIALPRDGRIICQTRDGELAPALGTSAREAGTAAESAASSKWPEHDHPLL